jgi:hypothetical protein
MKMKYNIKLVREKNSITLKNQDKECVDSLSEAFERSLIIELESDDGTVFINTSRYDLMKVTEVNEDVKRKKM